LTVGTSFTAFSTEAEAFAAAAFYLVDEVVPAASATVGTSFTAFSTEAEAFAAAAFSFVDEVEPLIVFAATSAAAACLRKSLRMSRSLLFDIVWLYGMSFSSLFLSYLLYSKYRRLLL
jgi:hypothetical protein